MGVKFTIAKIALHKGILRLKGLPLGDIAAIMPSTVGNGKDLSVVTDPAFLDTLESNHYGTESELVTAIGLSLMFDVLYHDYMNNSVRYILMNWDEGFQDN
jgi:hypothetical protein